PNAMSKAWAARTSPVRSDQTRDATAPARNVTAASRISAPTRETKRTRTAAVSSNAVLTASAIKHTRKRASNMAIRRTMRAVRATRAFGQRSRAAKCANEYAHTADESRAFANRASGYTRDERRGRWSGPRRHGAESPVHAVTTP